MRKGYAVLGALSIVITISIGSWYIVLWALAKFIHYVMGA